MNVTERTAADQDLDWGYILRPNGIEVINPRYAAAGPIVSWDADPRGDFNNPSTWPLTTERRPLTSPPTVRRTTTAGSSHAVARR